MKKLIIANWKMQLNYSASLSLAKKLAPALKAGKNEIVIAPDYLALPAVSQILKNTKLSLGAQDSAAALAGALTGEVSPVNLKTFGVKYVIIGHSERREHLHENSAVINAKIRAALSRGLIPVLCVGEKSTEKENGETKNYLATELRHALKGVKIASSQGLVIAYEPVWAISSQKGAQALPSAEAAAIHQFIKERAKKLLGRTVRVLYGGSVSAANAGEFLQEKNIDGLLIGSASLRLAEFKTICSL